MCLLAVLPACSPAVPASAVGSARDLLILRASAVLFLPAAVLASAAGQILLHAPARSYSSYALLPYRPPQTVVALPDPVHAGGRWCPARSLIPNGERGRTGREEEERGRGRNVISSPSSLFNQWK